MSPNLQQFYIEINTWIESGCKGHKFFEADSGLCYNLSAFCRNANLSEAEINYYSYTLREGFIRAAFEEHLPFNADYYSYRRESCQHTLYKNPARLAWIKNHLPKES